MSVDHILEKFNLDFDEQIKAFKDEGKTLIGCVTAYVPEEVAYAAGMMPIGLWGFPISINKSKQYFPAFYSSVVQSILEYGLEGKLDDFAALMIPGTTDSVKSLGQNCKRAFKQFETINIAYAQNRKLDAAVDFNEIQYKKAKEKLEKIAGNKITDDAIEEAIKVYNENRRLLCEFSELAAKHPQAVSPLQRSKVFTSRNIMDKKEHSALLKELNKALEQLPEEKWKGVKIVTSGIIGSYAGLLKIFEENKIAIVGDNVLEESGVCRYLVDEDSGNPVRALAKLISDAEGTSILYDVEKKRIDIIIDLVKKYNADGMIMLMLKFCDNEEFDYPIMKRAFDEAGIRALEVEGDLQMTDYGQASTLIQTFIENI